MAEDKRPYNGAYSPMARIRDYYLGLTISKKILLGYMIMALLLIITSLFTLFSLGRLNSIQEAILNRDVKIIELTERLSEVLVREEVYGRRYTILGSPEMLGIFWKSVDEAKDLIKTLSDMDKSAGGLIKLHDEFTELFVKYFRHSRDLLSPEAKRNDQLIKKKHEELSEFITKINENARKSQRAKILEGSMISLRAYRIAGILCMIGLIFGLVSVVFITHDISSSVDKLKKATQDIAEGRFDSVPDIKNKDELGDLARAFTEMAKRLKKLEEMYLDASPLTRLPGGIAIENVLRKRINSKTPLAFCLVDMDNFKAFNDRYGYARGSEVIKALGNIIEKAVKKHGMEEDFIGHIGGDDFVIITVPERYPKICGEIISEFDRVIVDFYDPEDRKLGYIIGKTRQGVEMKFPIMTVSIAVVTNQQRELTDPVQVGEIAAELKEYAKTIKGSLYVVDKRRKDSRQALSEENVIRFPRQVTDA
ncbi:MAG: diguanylate cyclase [Thermodesulfovibrionales bacterium]|nr:diguanylate cyclase [Thermodesulfovibrionales bacterium]